MNFKVFNIEFEGIDKSGKDSIMQQIFSVAPNKYIPKSRGLISQIAYSNLYDRDYNYLESEGYIENTLFVLLTVDRDDWKVRCDISHEHEKNKNRTDMEAAVEYTSNSQAFIEAYDYLYTKYKDKYSNHFMRFNTSSKTPYQIITEVVKRMDELNS